VIDVPKDGNHRRAVDQFFRVFLFDQAAPERNLSDLFFFDFWNFQRYFITQLGRHHCGGVEIDLLVNIGHHTFAIRILMT
jgi:hypothetical protein